MNLRRAKRIINNGEVLERFKRHAWKACVRQRTLSSNLSLSAIKDAPDEDLPLFITSMGTAAGRNLLEKRLKELSV